MYLKLENFRQYDSFEINLPDTGLVLLKGESGLGKTTIMLAIHDACYGDVQRVKPWNKPRSTPKITLRLNKPEKIEIIRTHTPDTLTVHTDRGELRDDEAQAEIHRVLGMNSIEAYASSYIRQRMSGSLLTLGAADQLRFIQRLAFGDEDPEVYKKKISGNITESNNATKVIEGSLSSLEESMSEQEKVLLDMQDGLLNKPKAPYTEDEMSDVATTKEVYANTIKECHEKIRQLDCEVRNPLYLVANDYNQTKSRLERQLSELNEQLAYQSGQLGALPVVMDNYKEIWDQAKNKIHAKGDVINARTRAIAINDEVRSRFPDTNGKLGEFLLSKISELKQHHDNLRSQEIAVRVEIANATNSPLDQECPSCGVHLVVDGGKITQANADQADREGIIAKSNQHLEKALHEISQISSDLVYCDTTLKEIDAIKNKILNDPLPEIKTLEHLESKKVDNDHFYQSQSVLSVNTLSYTVKIRDIKTEISKNENAMSILEKQVNQASELRPIDIVYQEKEDTYRKIKSTEGSIEELEKKQHIINEYKNTLLSYETATKVYENQERNIKILEQRVVTKKAELKESQLISGAWVRLKELSDFASVKSIEGIMSEINNGAAPHIERLFADCDTKVALQNISKTGKGEDRAKLSLDIVHKGSEIGKNYTDMSGGEWDRVVLAFQLSLSDIYDTPYVMIDEGFAGADVDKTMTAGLELLKDISQNKLILVIQHGAPEGFFDEIISP